MSMAESYKQPQKQNKVKDKWADFAQIVSIVRFWFPFFFSFLFFPNIQDAKTGLKLHLGDGKTNKYTYMLSTPKTIAISSMFWLQDAPARASSLQHSS